MQREKLAERGRGAGRSPTAVGGESRRSLLCSGGAGTGCARFCGPGKCGGGAGGSRCGGRAGACGGQVQGVGAWWGLRRAGARGGEGRRPPRRSRGRRALPAETVLRTVWPAAPCKPAPAKNPPTAVGGFRYLFRDYSSAGASSSTGSSSGASSASSALMDRLAR